MSFNNIAATDESMPPDIATTTFVDKAMRHIVLLNILLQISIIMSNSMKCRQYKIIFFLPIKMKIVRSHLGHCLRLRSSKRVVIEFAK